jgi:hypothetical protein
MVGSPKLAPLVSQGATIHFFRFLMSPTGPFTASCLRGRPDVTPNLILGMPAHPKFQNGVLEGS